MQKNALSILSHVAHGYVGNRAVVFTLQYCGWNVDALHTTEFLNHPGYGQFKGQKADVETVKLIFEGLQSILDLRLEYELILVGYCPSAEVMSTLYEQITPLMGAAKEKSRPILVVDPVLGDNGKLYVPQQIVKAHIEFLQLGFVDLTTPNQFELELLTGIQIHDWESVKLALTTFNEKYKVPNVVILSVIVDGRMYGVGFSKATEAIFYIPIAKIDCRFSGCGDVFTALLTNIFYENNCTLTPKVLSQVLIKLNRILMISFNEEKAKLGKAPIVVQDVRLIQLRKVLDENFLHDLEVSYL
ncbi:Ribokinase-like protein [Metschnikowia bicuspidata var. bicuspidata NRRL YB-4993]|uniref:pyridoxal kinase n=1 Tax=Metschnikowia bicuspidata var. bicuspidata NRRL YB-4993 TaxID=869754 RepID=A0A1A0HI32_9ASCO|nr:Ribokinase-like protein [Metschnikowia bicuspidata var. bicuspidata NRRL YB-4993]OBA23661.1 Ribokinase-like protein [Metschnikowia bicuspidata var. bicuspidata NRRL YB-4993]